MLQLVRSLMFQSNLSKKFYSTLMATYIINRLLSFILEWKTPFEILHNKKSSFNYLKVFGCLCYAINTLPHKDKFAPCAFRCIFI